MYDLCCYDLEGFDMGQIITFTLSKFFVLIFVVIFLTCNSYGKSHVITPNDQQTIIIESTSSKPINPGDTIFLIEGKYKQLLIRNLNGTATNPILLMNLGGVVVISDGPTYGVSFRNSSNIIFRSNSLKDHQIKIVDIINGNGISIEDRSSEITIAGIEINTVAKSGIMIKSDPTCGPDSPTRDNFILKNIKVHTNKIIGTGDEGIYAGSSFYGGQPLTCEGLPIIKLPHIIENIEIYDNTINSTGKDAIQVSSTPEECKIYNNHITQDSQDQIINQSSGILIGTGCKCYVYNNFIEEGNGGGIEVFGKPGTTIFNNIIVNPGRNLFPELPPNLLPKHGIYINNRFNEDEFFIYIFNNTIINPKTNGITLASRLSKPSAIVNNLILNPGAFPLTRTRSFVFSSINQSEIISQGNYFTLVEDGLFSDLSVIPYYPSADSPLINGGVFIDFFDLDFDFYKNKRPMNGQFDIGALEYQEEVLQEDNLIHFKLFPNPSSSFVNVELSLNKTKMIEFRFVNSLGQTLKNTFYFNDSYVFFTIETATLPKGIYFMIATIENQSYSKVLIKN